MRSTGARTLTIAVLMAAVALFATAASAVAAPRSVGGVELNWGVKEEFRSYVEHVAIGGKIEVAEGATEAADGTYRFPVVAGSYEPLGREASVQFAGSVRFSAYAFGGAPPLLDITIKDPKIVLDGDEGTLFAHVLTRNETTLDIEDHPNLDLAELDATGIAPVETAGTVTWAGIPAFLTADGVPVFGAYPVREGLDPVSILATPVAPPAEETKKPDAASTSPSTTTTDTEAPVTMPTLKSTSGSMTVGNGGSATVATVACPSGGSCTLKAPRTVKVKIGGQTFTAKVIAPHSILAGQSAKVTVKLPRAALAELAGGKVKVGLKLVLGSGSQSQTKFVKATLKAKAS